MPENLGNLSILVIPVFVVILATEERGEAMLENPSFLGLMDLEE